MYTDGKRQFKNTHEWLAVRFPHVAHLVPELEDTCKTIAQVHQGWGTVTLQAKGLDDEKRLVVPIIDVLLRYFRKDDKARKSS